TITRRLATISQAHQQAGHPTPTSARVVRDVLQGIKREKGAAPAAKAAAVTAIIRAMVDTMDDDLKGKRDRALILLGFAGAFRRSELVGLTVAAVQFTNDGLIVKLPHSKTDQEGLGETKGIPLKGFHQENRLQVEKQEHRYRLCVTRQTFLPANPQ